MPGGEEEEANQNQGAGQPDPDAGDTPAIGEAEDIGDGQADHPVPGQVGEGWSARVAESTQGAGGDYLESIEDFEEGGDAQEGGTGGNDRGLGGVKAGDPAGHEGKRQTGGAHESGAEQQGSPAGDGDAVRGLPADSVADPDGGGRTDAERDHVGDGDDVDGDAVRGERDLVEAGGHDGDGTEDGAFDENLHGGGESEGEQAADDWEMGTVGKRGVIGDSG